MAVLTRDHVTGGSAEGYLPVPSPRQPAVCGCWAMAASAQKYKVQVTSKISAFCQTRMELPLVAGRAGVKGVRVESRKLKTENPQLTTDN
jgi:hypothetical protein